MTAIATMEDSQIISGDISALDFEKIGSTLKRGGLVVSPTETSYGLLARVDDKNAVGQLFELKGRDETKPSAIFVHDLTEMNNLGRMSNTAQAIAKEFLPGALTMVLKSKHDFGAGITLNGFSGFRWSSSPVMSSIMKECDFLLTATSANISGHPTANTIDEIKKQLGDGVELYIDGGILNNPPSTVVQIVEDDIKILRTGAISEDDIRRAARN